MKEPYDFAVRCNSNEQYTALRKMAEKKGWRYNNEFNPFNNFSGNCFFFSVEGVGSKERIGAGEFSFSNCDYFTVSYYYPDHKAQIEEALSQPGIGFFPFNDTENHTNLLKWTDLEDRVKALEKRLNPIRGVKDATCIEELIEALHLTRDKVILLGWGLANEEREIELTIKAWKKP